MISSSNSDVDVHRSAMADLRSAWIKALIENDVEQLEPLVTDDIVAIHGNGQCSCGKEQLRRDFRQALKHVDIERVVPCSELVVHGQWAVAVDEVKSTRTLDGTYGSVDSRFKAVFVFQRQSDNSWKVARVMELLG